MLDLMAAAAVLLPVIMLLGGWIVLIGVGIHRLAKGRRTGTAYLVIGGVWAVAAIGIVVVGGWLFADIRNALDVETFDPDAHEGPVGAVRVDWGGAGWLVVRSDDRPGRLATPLRGGRFLLPPGDYHIVSITFQGSGPGGWTLSANPVSRNNRLPIGSGATTALPAGPPVVARVDAARMRDGRAHLNFILHDENGAFTYRLHAPDGSAPAPGFEAFDASGNRVWSGRFAYG